ncbi:MAG: hypothetical protein R2912_02485 [Eubacteriales bacterium]
MRKAAAEGFINATDAADYLVKKGMPFERRIRLRDSSLRFASQPIKRWSSCRFPEYRTLSDLFEGDIYDHGQP